MQKSSLHTHTVFCDGHDDIEAFCQAAWAGGFASLGFSAHAPFTKKTNIPSDWHLSEDRLEEYIQAVRAARLRWEGRLQVYLGLEVDYVAGLIGPADGDYAELGLDYIIGSVHVVLSPQGEPFIVDDSQEEFQEGFAAFFHRDKDALLDAYCTAIEEMIAAGGYSILGHLDLIKKNNAPSPWFSPLEEGYMRRMRRLAILAGESSGVVEINTGGLARGYTKDTYPSVEILQLLCEQGVPITVNLDAHRVGHLQGYHEIAWDTLRRSGYTRVQVIAGSTAGIPQWREEDLF